MHVPGCLAIGTTVTRQSVYSIPAHAYTNITCVYLAVAAGGQSTSGRQITNTVGESAAAIASHTTSRRKLTSVFGLSPCYCFPTDRRAAPRAAKRIAHRYSDVVGGGGCSSAPRLVVPPERSPGWRRKRQQCCNTTNSRSGCIGFIWISTSRACSTSKSQQSPLTTRIRSDF